MSLCQTLEDLDPEPFGVTSSRYYESVPRCYACEDPIKTDYDDTEGDVSWQDEAGTEHTIRHFNLCNACTQALGQPPNELL